MVDIHKYFSVAFLICGVVVGTTSLPVSLQLLFARHPLLLLIPVSYLLFLYFSFLHKCDECIDG